MTKPWDDMIVQFVMELFEATVVEVVIHIG